MPDALLSATAAASGIAVTSVVSTDLVREIRARHDLSPTITAALGRLTTGAVLFGASLKGSDYLLESSCEARPTAPRQIQDVRQQAPGHAGSLVWSCPLAPIVICSP